MKSSAAGQTAFEGASPKLKAAPSNSYKGDVFGTPPISPRG